MYLKFSCSTPWIRPLDHIHQSNESKNGYDTRYSSTRNGFQFPFSVTVNSQLTTAFFWPIENNGPQMTTSLSMHYKRKLRTERWITIIDLNIYCLLWFSIRISRNWDSRFVSVYGLIKKTVISVNQSITSSFPNHVIILCGCLCVLFLSVCNTHKIIAQWLWKYYTWKVYGGYDFRT